jgi:NAD(P)-dependent dehydrogenase (short-subunit alcohol dehydrogenase family)
MFSYSPAPDLFAQHNILVTGAADGIGRELALACARHGATVILLDKNQRGLEAVYDQIEQEGGAQPALLPVDLATATEETYQELHATLVREFSSLHGLAHNAAELGALAPLEHYDAGLWARVMQVNLHAPFLLTRACLPLLRATDQASIVFSSSAMARQGKAYWGAYAVAGFAVEGMMQVLADELETNTRIRVNSLDPGPVNTRLRSRAYPGEDGTQLAEPAAVIPAYLYLLGPDSQRLNGQALSAEDPKLDLASL